mgnify:FL=1
MDNKKVNSDLWEQRYVNFDMRSYKMYLDGVQLSLLGNKNRFKDE